MKPVVFHGGALQAVRAFPGTARQRAGYEIDRVQRGLPPLNWKPLSSIGPGVREIRIQVGMQYQVIYLANAVHVLHAFQKKTQKTSKNDIDIARKRFRQLLAEARK